MKAAQNGIRVIKREVHGQQAQPTTETPEGV